MKTLKTIIISLLILVTCGWTSYHTHHYNRKAIITDVECIEVTAEDMSGHRWKFTGTGYYIGQKVTLKMYDNHTDSIITDDSVVDVVKR